MSDDELKAMLVKLVAKIDEEAARNADFRAGVDSQLACINARLTGIDKRQDDQNAILAAMIPVKIAAVGGR
ncbi:MAG: hypothetical protein WCF85_01115 [Rhodospirillaceae bacterium]